MEGYEFWFSPLDYNYYLNNEPISKEIMDMRMEDRLNILQREISMLELQNLSGEEKRLIMEEMERIAIELKEKGKGREVSE